MSLDVYLEVDRTMAVSVEKNQIFIRENGQTKSISREEWDRRNPGFEPVILQEKSETTTVYSANITHNLQAMAMAVSINNKTLHDYLWQPEKVNTTKAKDLDLCLAIGLATLKGDPERFKQYNPANGWGNYELLVEFVERYLEACQRYPEAKVSVWR